jgi:hypothetical protein
LRVQRLVLCVCCLGGVHPGGWPLLSGLLFVYLLTSNGCIVDRVCRVSVGGHGLSVGCFLVYGKGCGFCGFCWS